AVRRRMTPAQVARAKARLEASRSAIAAARERLVAAARAEARQSPMKPAALLQAIGETLPPDAVVVEETLSSSAGLRQFLKSEDRQSFFGMRGGGIGWALPAAVGVKLALPGRPVVALVG